MEPSSISPTQCRLQSRFIRTGRRRPSHPSGKSTWPLPACLRWHSSKSAFKFCGKSSHAVTDAPNITLASLPLWCSASHPRQTGRPSDRQIVRSSDPTSLLTRKRDAIYAPVPSFLVTTFTQSTSGQIH